MSVSSEIKIDVSLIPEYTQKSLAGKSLRMVWRILQQPGGREAIERKKLERIERLKAQEAES